MKRIIAVFIAAVLLFASVPSFAGINETRGARTTLLDLSEVTEVSYSTKDGWYFDPTAYNGNPQLTLTRYGSASAHSAPIIVPTNTRVVINGDCYIDNVYMNGEHDVLQGGPDGYLIIEGNGTLNLYANQYNGRCINQSSYGENVHIDELVIKDITVNCYGLERTNNNAATLRPCIYGHQKIKIINAVVNTYFGSCGIKAEGYTPIGGVSEETADEILIEDSVVNIQNYSANDLWSFARGIWTTFGKIRISGNSDVTINAGSRSIYSYLSFTIEGGRVNILSMPVSTYYGEAIVFCGRLKITNDIESVYFSTVSYPLTTVLHCKDEDCSTAGSELQYLVGGFEGGNYYTAGDPDNGDLPALKIVGSSTAVHTVAFYGFDGSLISRVSVPDGQPVTPPEVERVQNNADGTFVFYGWDAELDCVTEDMEVHAQYTLLGDTDLNGTVASADALLIVRYTMHLQDLTERQICAGNVTLDDKLDSSDALIIVRYVMRLIPSLV
ncbi:MAG: dockerin type I repeat-containing protein [Clostridiales bacterium]|nr:dockerin type I repeat-containing protein [Clostridiales bacterium]